MREGRLVQLGTDSETYFGMDTMERLNAKYSTRLPKSIGTLSILCLSIWPHLAGNSFCQELPSIDQVEFSTELNRLAKISERLQLSEQAALSRNWIPRVLPDRDNLFLTGGDLPKTRGNSAAESWLRHFMTARQKFAETAFKRSRNLVAQDESEAYRWLWRASREWPSHPGAKRVLGPLLRSIVARPRLTRGRQVHPAFGWPAGSYSRIETAHFDIVTRAGPKESIDLALRMEEFYVLWSQFFYELWAPAGLLKEKLAGKNRAWPKHKGMEVFILADRSDYLRTLGIAEGNIGVSVGYYNPGARKSFFYPDENLQATLVHELTHQLLLEASRISPRADAGVDGGIWQIEGIALFMESLREEAGYWTVGGIDATRNQTARYRAVRDGYWPAWDSFVTGKMEDWKADPSIARLYTHAAGLTHYFLNLADADAKKRFIRALVDLYQGNARSGLPLLESLSADEEKAKELYQDQMIVDDEKLAWFSENVQDLVLCGSQLKPESWKQISRFSKLQWLDVSFSNCVDAHIETWKELSELRRLSFEGTAAGPEVIQLAAGLLKLEELDLSGMAVKSKDLEPLKSHPSLKTLWLTNTQVTEDAFPVLESISNLTQCDIEGSQISSEAWQQFIAKNDRLSN